MTTSSTAPQAPAVPSLDDRFQLLEGRVFLNGNQALIRMMVDQMRADAAAGLRTRAYVTGYPGSPLGGIDMALHRAQPVLDAHGIRHQPGQNEELAATALMGTQMLDEYPHPDVDGVVGYWYGKGPGLDRSGDALKHGNFAGTSEHGAVVILSGEDHEAKSSTVPYQMEFAFEHHGIPVLYPSSVQEFVDYGLHAAALSRFSGCWVALKLVGSLCDGGEVVHLSASRVQPRLPEVQFDGLPFRKTTNHKFFPGTNIVTERELYTQRHEAVLAYARANRLDRVTVRGNHDRIGILAAGKSHADAMQALHDLGFEDDSDLNAAGIRVGKVALLCPLDDVFVREFAQGLDLVIVVEEKRDFLERQVGRALVGTGSLRLVGKRDTDGSELFPIAGGMNADIVTERLARVLAREGVLPAQAEDRLGCMAAGHARNLPAQPGRSVNFCSGCPHNVSTRLAPGQVAWGAPGCHIIAAVMDRPERKIVNVTQLGGEGLPWIGLAPYTSRRHIVQNVGDGALYHSSYQNIRYAISSGVNITFKLLLNGVIANTGGQESVAAFSLPVLLNHLVQDGVKRIVLITKEVQRHGKGALPASVVVRGPEELESSLVELEKIDGVTVLVYDGECANERRRRQKRGKLPPPQRFTFVNEDVCENCGDCGQKANCMSLQKVDTEFGRKTQIHQSSCNQDQNCVNGECPSFVSVDVVGGARPRKPKKVEIDASGLPAPQVAPLERPYHVYVPGLGGTGVLTANAILAQAAALDGLEVKTYDQTGAAQKWGAVLSSLILAPAGRAPHGNRVGAGKADLYLALDLMAGVDKANLACCDAGRTAAVINSNVLPNGSMIRDPKLVLPTMQMVEAIRGATRGDRAITLDARAISEGLFGDYMMTNMVAIGAAWQAGLLPISAASIETAIRMNGAQAHANIQAFRAGRLAQHDAGALRKLLPRKPATLADRRDETLQSLSQDDHAWVRQAVAAAEGLPAEANRQLHVRTVDLLGYQGRRLAKAYVDTVAQVAARERAVAGVGSNMPVTQAVVRNLHKVLAYKDEYEVARLLTQQTFDARVAESFEGSTRISYNLQPPLARVFGMKRKMRLGPWFRPALVALAKLRFVRGTAFDPFGYMHVRRAERAWADWYRQLVADVLPRLTLANWEAVAELLALPDQVRGYEDIKLRAIDEAKAKAPALLAKLSQAAAEPAPLPVDVARAVSA
ncbi:indolepyruvate ferredoxin oxidoreductase family protein [Ramlibacter sp. USB13]|uniref:Indolepyruvate ferredoxin oxidoreductase family protein n=1 Tax=Ramlibacter cellulosilyticus TaxID=2764187 RepID=A0A923ML18_9BURK|nr:indolepyruvate ferredoxin oxidoreductase family protein [Ramlibacter cellulosilyticus]MBC5781475.1 indolepyruvate ferredoxin oxidoreductase family protein [Ramlibacter cellulosilyticus]